MILATSSDTTIILVSPKAAAFEIVPGVKQRDRAVPKPSREVLETSSWQMPVSGPGFPRIPLPSGKTKTDFAAQFPTWKSISR